MIVHVFTILNPLPPLSPYHPAGSSQCTSPEHPVSCIKAGLVIRFTYDILHVSLPFSHIILLSPSPRESKRLFYTSVSLLLSHIQGYCYHLSKFHSHISKISKVIQYFLIFHRLIFSLDSFVLEIVSPLKMYFLTFDI